jgi:hypothetical protein
MYLTLFTKIRLERKHAIGKHSSLLPLYQSGYALLHQ